MKKYFLTLLIFAIIFGNLTFTSVAAVNYLSNAGFELGNTTSWAPRAGYPALNISNDSYQGNYSVICTMTPTNHNHSFYQTVTVEKGVTYYVEAYAKLVSAQELGNNNSIKIKLHGDDSMPVYNDWYIGNIIGGPGNYTGVSLSPDKWTKASGKYQANDFTTPSCTAMLLIQTLASDNVSILVDSVRFEKLEASKINLTGTNLINISSAEAVHKPYAAEILNQLEETDEVDQRVTWTLDKAYDDVQIDSGGNLTVQKNAAPKTVILTAAPVSDATLTASKTIRIAAPSTDYKPPVITLAGDDTVYIKRGGTYKEYGAAAYDDTDGDITGFIIIDSGNVNTSATGEYRVTYNVSDAAGNEALEVVRNVIVYDGNINISKNEFGSVSVTAPNYEITITPNGLISFLSISGEEFSRLGMSYSETAYDYDNLNYAFKNIKRTASNVVTASADNLSIEYKFNDSSMEWKIINNGLNNQYFNFVLSKKAGTVRDYLGNYSEMPVCYYGKKADVFGNYAKLGIVTAVAKIFPKEGDTNLAVRIDAPKNASTTYAFSMSAASQSEIDGIASMRNINKENINVLSPKTYQVVQRNTKYDGDLLINGTCIADCDSIEVQVSGNSAFSGALPEKWVSIPYNSKTKVFNKKITLPAGGWYKMTVRALKNNEVAALIVINNIGVGEVFVMSGQSNSTNSGETVTQTQTQMVSSFNGDTWRLADDPQLGVLDFSSLGSAWPAFGDKMYEYYGVPVGIASTGAGGKAVDEWRPPSSQAYVWLINRVKTLGIGGFRAVLWHQGEADAALSAAEYTKRLRAVINGARKEAGWNFPWFAAQIQSFSKVQALLDDGTVLDGAHTCDLGPEYHITPANAHFNAAGLKLHGEMWADKVKVYLDEELAVEDDFTETRNKDLFALIPSFTSDKLVGGAALTASATLVNPGTQKSSALLLIAIYNESGVLIGSKFKAGEVLANSTAMVEVSIDLPNVVSGCKAKAMVWTDEKYIIPLTSAKELE
jgi:hypothetical protein